MQQQPRARLANFEHSFWCEHSFQANSDFFQASFSFFLALVVLVVARSVVCLRSWGFSTR
jgi:hypothetical protein